MSQIVYEVSRRMTPEYARERAREMARDRMYRARDHAVESSWLAPILGAGIGALVAKAVQARAQERRRDEERYAYGYPRHLYGHPRGEYAGPGGAEDYDLSRGEVPQPGSSFGEKASEVRDRARDKASEIGDTASEMKDRARETAFEMKDRARAKTDELKDRIHGATSSLRERLPDRERVRTSAREDLALWGFGALALGALFGFALPVTQRERELLEPARRKARQLGEQAREKIVAKGSEAMDTVTEKVAQQLQSPGDGQSQGTQPLH